MLIISSSVLFVGAGFKVPLKGIAGYVAKTGQKLVLDDCYSDERFGNSDYSVGTYYTTWLLIRVLELLVYRSHNGHENGLQNQTNDGCSW